MPHIFSDPSWQFVINLSLVILAILVAIFVPLVIYWLQKQKKQLSFTDDINVSLLNYEIKNSPVAERFKFLFDDKEVKDFFLFVISIINSGNQPIVASDFECDLEFIFDVKNEILSAGVDKHPESLKLKYEYKENKVFIKPLLLNRDEYFKLIVLVSGEKSRPQIYARIAGVKDISVYIDTRPFEISAIVTFGFLLLNGLFVALGTLNPTSLLIFVLSIISTIIVTIGVILTTVMTIRATIRRKKVPKY